MSKEQEEALAIAAYKARVYNINQVKDICPLGTYFCYGCRCKIYIGQSFSWHWTGFTYHNEQNKQYCLPLMKFKEPKDFL